MIEVTTDPGRRRVIARMGGMLTIDEVKAFSVAEQDAARSLGLGSGEFDLLTIAIGNLVQTQAVMEAFAELIHHSPLKARKIATVRDGVLTRMQTRRMTQLRSNAAVFETLAEAEAWLDEPLNDAGG